MTLCFECNDMIYLWHSIHVECFYCDVFFDSRFPPSHFGHGVGDIIVRYYSRVAICSWDTILDEDIHVAQYSRGVLSLVMSTLSLHDSRLGTLGM